MRWLRNLHVDTSWYDFFVKQQDVLTYINDYLSKVKYYPIKNKIFNCFTVRKSDVRVVFIGEHPYEAKGLATGNAFATPHKDLESVELMIIKDELFRYNGNFFIDYEFDYTLETWKKQGVLLLNSALTVFPNKKKSHNHIWEEFFINVLKYLNSETTGLIFVFCGKHVQKYNDIIDQKVHTVINVETPRKDGFSKNDYFKGSKIFKKIDDILFNINGEKIEWVNLKIT